MAIVDLDNVPSRRRRRGDPVAIGGLAGAILAFALAMWMTAPHPAPPVAARPTASPSIVQGTATSGGPITTTALTVTGDPVSVLLNPGTAVAVTVIPPGGPIIGLQTTRTLVLPPWANGVDLFQVPDRLTNENLIWTLRNVVHIRGGTGLSSVEGPAVITWTENGFQYWMVSPTRSTDELVDIANGLK